MAVLEDCCCELCGSLWACGERKALTVLNHFHVLVVKARGLGYSAHLPLRTDSSLVVLGAGGRIWSVYYQFIATEHRRITFPLPRYSLRLPIELPFAVLYRRSSE